MAEEADEYGAFIGACFKTSKILANTHNLAALRATDYEFSFRPPPLQFLCCQIQTAAPARISTSMRTVRPRPTWTL